MSKNEWGSEWPVEHTGKAIAERQKQDKSTLAWPSQSKVNNNLDWLTHTSDVANSSHSGVEFAKLKSQGSNLVDTECYLYFQCEGCQNILDPHTKSFKTLQEHRVNAGWACKWNIDGMGYKVYCAECAECGEKVK